MFRTVAARCLAVLAGAVAATSIAMPSGFADNVYYSTLDVASPTVGSIDSVDSNFNQIHCGPAAPGPCTITDQQSELGSRPTGGWYTYQLAASGGPAGYSWHWTSGCSGWSSTCTIVNDQEYTQVAGEWVDTEGPVITAVHIPTWANGPVDVSVEATDNSGTVAQYLWTICPQFAPECTVFATTTEPQYHVPSLPDGAYLIDVQALDAIGNASGLGYDWLNVDTVAPKITLRSPAANATLDAFVAVVDFRVNETSISESQCRVDADDWQDCGPGWPTRPLDTGAHAVSVRMVDDAGNDTIVRRKFTVVEPHVTLVGTPESVYGERASISVQVPKYTTAQVEFDDAATGGPLCVKPATASGKVTCTFSGTHFGPGAHDVFVRFTGDATHAMAGATFAYTVDRRPSSITAVAQHGQYGEAYPVQVTVLPKNARGTVEFHAGATLLCRAHVRHGVASCSAPGTRLAIGKYQVTANYLGDETHAPASATFRLTVRA